jgi:hypothetical protein
MKFVMKRVIALLLLVCFSTTFIVAQDTKSVKKEPAKKVTTTVDKEVKTDNKANPPAGVPTKKDGTPDMRYKENKEAAKAVPAGPTKKDGTLDMRYKENKEAATKKK